MRIAIDTGGTFTDCVYAGDKGVEILKIPSTPADPGEAVVRAVAAVDGGEASDVRHGTTVGTNALLERKGARVAFVTTKGFEDTIAIGRQARPKLYDLFWAKEVPLVSADLRFGVAERTGSDGSILEALSSDELGRIKQSVQNAHPEAVAISLLFGFANASNEKALAEVLREIDVPVSVAHEILPEFREYERASTVSINAYLQPTMQRYLEKIDRELRARGARFHVMQSSGGIISAKVAAREPVRTILSGPAGGVVGARAVAEEAGYGRILTFDMGGTSTDVALVDGDAGLETTKESLIQEMPVAVPMLNIHTVGAGGGSIGRFDRGGVLKVGPESAGAEPGPICYGRGGLPTVTDANLLLGRLDTLGLLGGTMPLNEERVRERFCRAKGALQTAEQFAEGIIRVVDSHMEKALRRISVEKGHDPREFVLVSFGGAGPLHAVALARALRIKKVLVPNFPGALSAFGILVSDAVRDYSRTVMLRPGDEKLEEHFCELEDQARQEMAAEGWQSAEVLPSLEMRYAGQGYELAVTWSGEFVEQFHRLHEQRYGYSDPKREIEIVNARVRIIVRTEGLTTASPKATNMSTEYGILKRKPIYFDGSWLDATIYDRARLGVRARVQGPAVIVEYSATTFLPPGSAGTVDDKRNLIVEVDA
jgi:N-methylhydantoinase A